MYPSRPVKFSAEQVFGRKVFGQKRFRPNNLSGKKLFFDAQGIGCAKCHAVDKEGMANIGPNLLGVGGKYPKDELIRSVLEVVTAQAREKLSQLD